MARSLADRFWRWLPAPTPCQAIGFALCAAVLLAYGAGLLTGLALGGRSGLG